jgi:hypothetical protein
MAEYPDVYKIIEIHLGSGSFTQYQAYTLLMITAIITDCIYKNSVHEDRWSN